MIRKNMKLFHTSWSTDDSFPPPPPLFTATTVEPTAPACPAAPSDCLALDFDFILLVVVLIDMELLFPEFSDDGDGDPPSLRVTFGTFFGGAPLSFAPTVKVSEGCWWGANSDFSSGGRMTGVFFGGEILRPDRVVSSKDSLEIGGILSGITGWMLPRRPSTPTTLSKHSSPGSSRLKDAGPTTSGMKGNNIKLRRC